MRLRPLICQVLFLTLACLAMSARHAVAQDAESVDHFRLLPRLSVLHRTGGFAGVDERLRLTGKFDLAHAGSWAGDARFENAEVWGSLISPFPTPAVVTDVDELLNLEGLDGEQLPVAGPFDAYRFTGKIADGSSIDLFATQIGPWLGLRGFTTPPPHSADFFEYELRAVARRRPVADFNDDGAIDADDLAAWAAGVGPMLDGGAQRGDDLLSWQRQLGENPPLEMIDAALSAAIASTKSSLAAVPEPATASLVALVLLGVARRRGRQRLQ